MNLTNKMRPIHPGEALREELPIPLGVSAHALAMELKVPAQRINDIVRERRSVTSHTALRILPGADSGYLLMNKASWLCIVRSLMFPC